MLVCFSMLLDLVSVSVLFSPFMCLDDIKLGLGSGVATFWERVAHSVSNSFCLYSVYLLFWLFSILVSMARLLL